jgi:uncharacterized cupredoxin-like copper-binding protein
MFFTRNVKGVFVIMKSFGKGKVPFVRIGSFLVVFAFVLAACGGGGQSSAPPPQAPASGSGGGSNTLEIGVQGEELLYDKETLEATIAEGEELTIEFTNDSQTQEHNFILLNTDDLDKAEEFNDAGATYVDTFYVPEDNQEMMDMVIDYVNNQPGETKTLTISAPPPGDYLYVCTVPGHYAAGMYGTLTITAP